MKRICPYITEGGGYFTLERRFSLIDGYSAKDKAPLTKNAKCAGRRYFVKPAEQPLRGYCN
jgi:hypothetical protein